MISFQPVIAQTQNALVTVEVQEAVYDSIPADWIILQLNQGEDDLTIKLSSSQIVPAAVFEALSGTDKALHFEIYDGDTVLYRWNFCPKSQVLLAQDVNLGINFDVDCGLLEKYDMQEVATLELLHTGRLPSGTTIDIVLDSKNAKADKMHLYLSDDGKTRYVSDAIISDAGLVTLSLETGGTYLLSTQLIKGAVGNPPSTGASEFSIVVVVIIIESLLLVSVLLLRQLFLPDEDKLHTSRN